MSRTSCVLSLLLTIPLLFLGVVGIAVANPSSSPEVVSWNDDQIEEALQNVLLQPEYRNLRRDAGSSELELGWLDRLLERLFGDDNSPKTSPSGSAMNLPDLSVLVISLVVLVVLSAIVIWIRTRRSGEKTPRLPDAPPFHSTLEEGLPGDHKTNEWVGRARFLAASGNHDAAIRCLLFGGMSWTEEHGFLRHRPGLTNRSYVRALHTQPVQGVALREIVDAFERIYFGHREASAEIFSGCLETFTKGFLHDDRPEQALDR